MKDNIIYNQPDNKVMVRSDGDRIVIICKKENQIQTVINRMTTDTCIFTDYEEWDEDKDMKWILTFKVLDDFNQLLRKN